MSSDDKTAVLKITADATGAQAGFDKVKTGARDMGQAVTKESEKAGKAVDGIGDGAAPAAGKLDNATRSMIASVQRTTAAMQAGEKGTAKFYEALAAQRGVDVAVLQPYIDQLKQVEASQKKVGVSAAQTAAAMRGVPAQMTDIVTSLQGGQAPMTVLLQQGGQLKDMFGGAGNAARALGGYIVGMVNPFTVAAAAVASVGFAYMAGRSEAESYAKALTLTGNAVGVTAAQMTNMAAAISHVSGTQGNAAEALNAFVSTARVGGENLQAFTLAAVQFEKATGQAVSKTAEQFADLAKDPLAATLKLNDGMNYLTRSTYEQIKSLTEQGRVTEAASVAQKAFADTLSDRSGDMLKQLGLVERSWKNIKDAVAGAVDAAKGIGRADFGEAELARVRNMIDTKNQGLQALRGTAAGDVMERELALLRAQESVLQSNLREVARGVALRAQEAEQVKALAAYEAIAAKHMGDEKRIQQEIAQVRQAGLKAKKSEQEIEELVAAVRAKNAPKVAAASQTEAQALQSRLKESQQYLDYLQEHGKEMDKLTDGEREVLKIREALSGNLTVAARQEKERSLAIAMQVADVEKRLQKERDELSIIKESGAINYKAWEDQSKRTASLAQEVQRQKEHNEAIGQTKEATEVLAAARLEDAAAAAEQKAAQQDLVSPAIAQELREQARLYRELANLKRDGGAMQAAADAAKKATDEWQKAADQINQSLTDALMRGFESGKGFAENLRDATVNMFKTMVLRPTIQAVVTSGMSGLGIGGAPSAFAGQAGGSMLGGLSFGGASLTAMGESFGTGFLTTIQGGSVTAAAEAYGAAGMSGVSGGLSAGASAAAAIPYVAAALVAANALGLFRSDAVVGGGLSGTLGAGDINAYDLNREGGTLFDGPNYSLQNKRLAEQSAAIQAAYGVMRTSVAGMATQLGLANDSILSFTQQLGKDIIHPDTGGIGIKLDGLTNEQATAKIAEAMATANEELARQVLGTMKTVTSTVVEQINNTWDESGPQWSDVTRTVTEQVYVASEFARTGETAATTLTRLATSLGSVNSMFDLLGHAAMAASLSGADMASQLVDQFGGADAFKQAAGAYYQAYYSEAERNAKITEQLTTQMTSLGLAMPANTEAFRALVDAQDLTTVSGRKAFAALMAMGPAFKQVADAADAAAQAAQAQAEKTAQAAKDQADAVAQAMQAQADAARAYASKAGSGARSATDAAYAALERAANAERKVVQARIDAAAESVQTLTAVFDLLKTNVADLYAEVSSTAAQTAAAGRSFIDQALAAAQRTGYLPDQAGLQSAVQAVRAEMGSKTYASAFEQARDRLVLAGQLGQLKDLTGEQLSESEKMLKVAQSQLSGIDAQVDLAKQQLEAMRGVDSGIVSVSDAINKLAQAMGIEKQFAPEQWQAAGGKQVWSSTGGASAVKTGSGLDIYGADGSRFTGAEAVGWVNQQLAANDAASVYAKAVATGISSSSLDALMGWSAGTSSGWAAANKLPAFANGGLHTGGLRIVGEREPELEVTGPARYYTAQGMKNMLAGGSSADQTAEIRALREDLAAQSRALVQQQNMVRRLFERWDAEGMPKVRSNTV